MKILKPDKTNSATVVLFSYMRPELTERAILNLEKWKNINRLIVSIDGLRVTATPEEKMWRMQTIEVSRKLATQFENIEVIVWDLNKGLTDHAIRAFNRALNHSNNVISIEEDVEISEEGLDFLNIHSLSEVVPQIASSFSKYSHFSQVSEYKVTVFPEQWGTSFNKLLYQEFLSVVSGKPIRREKIKEVMDEVFGPNSRLSLKATKYWYGLYRAAQNDLNHGDALMSYAAISSGIKYRVPWESLSTDIADLDHRGMHKRGKKKSYPVHRSKVLVINDEVTCPRCELLNSQVKTDFQLLVKALLYKIRVFVIRS